MYGMRKQIFYNPDFFGYLFSLAPGPIKFLTPVFDFSPVWVIKCSCAALIKHNYMFSIKRLTESTSSSTSGQAGTKNEQTSTTSG